MYQPGLRDASASKHNWSKAHGSIGLLSVVQLSFGEPPWFFLCMFGAMFAQKLGLFRSHIDREDVNEIMLLLTKCAQRCLGVGMSQVEEILPVVDVTVLQPHSPD